jgi:signal transduction histidine kinase
VVEGLGEAAAVGAWPVAVTMACALAADRRRASRRRQALNRALHELRRPLQALVLARSAPDRSPDRDLASGHLDAAIAALGDLDAQVNGRAIDRPRRAIWVRRLLAEGVGRWRSPAALLGRELELSLPIGEPLIHADPSAISRALDNLIANSLEHGARRIRIGARVRGRRIRISVVDGFADSQNGCGSLAGPLARAPAGDPDPRRGHGLGVVARIASEHGGRFAFRRGDAGTIAMLELPLLDPGRPAG